MKILICDDHAMFRQGLRGALEELEFDLVEASDGGEALDLVANDEAIALVLLDLQMPGVDGWVGLRRLREDHPAVSVVIVSASENPEDMRAALDSGASGFIPKSSSPAVVRAALQLVLEGSVYVPPELLASLNAVAAPAGDSAKKTKQAQRGEALTPRQREVLNLISRGLTNKEIADVLKIAPGTVKTHVAALLDALAVTNRTEATLVMKELGLDEE